MSDGLSQQASQPPLAGGGSGGGGGSADSLLSLRLIVPDQVSPGSDSFTGKIIGTYSDGVAAGSDAASVKLTLTDSVNAPTDARPVVSVRYFGTAASDNDSAKTVPANANAAPDGVFAKVSTALSLGDLINPVTLSSGVFAVPAAQSLTVKSALLRVWFKVAGVAALLTDTMTIAYSGAGSGTLFAPPTAAAFTGVDYTASGLTFDVSALTLAQLGALQLTASYTSAVVAVPQTAIFVDAWAVEINLQT